MTLLEFLLTHYRGKPNSVRADGVSYWNCPVCGHYSFHTLPIRGEFTKERAKCWNAECEFRGDAMDMLEHFHPEETKAALFKRLDRLRGSYQQQKSRSPRFAAGSTPGKKAIKWQR